MSETMRTHRGRPYSFSSNETIIEDYSSSPGTSAGLPDHDWNSLESIDWDENPEEGEESQLCHRYLKRQSTFPQTVGYWFDSWIAEVGTTAKNVSLISGVVAGALLTRGQVDLQALCAGMQMWREKNEVERIRVCQGQPSQQPPSMVYSVHALRSEDGSYVCRSDWDALLREVKDMARDIHQARKRREQERKSAAGWCKWGAKERVKERGDFVEELEVGYEIQREADGQKWWLKLGYRRHDAVVEDVDLEEDDRGGRVVAEDVCLSTKYSTTRL